MKRQEHEFAPRRSGTIGVSVPSRYNVARRSAATAMVCGIWMATISLALVGCDGGTSAAYSGAQRPDSAVATIKGYLESTPATRIGLLSAASPAELRIADPAKHDLRTVEIASVDDYSTGSRPVGYSTTVKALPGTHRIGLFCGYSTAFASPIVIATLSAGKSYEVDCDYEGDGRYAD
jgi:hypothetical protein